MKRLIFVLALLISLPAAAQTVATTTTLTANASATPFTYRGQYSVLFTTEAACAASSAARNDPPDVYSYPCESVVISGTTEWHYWYKYLIS